MRRPPFCPYCSEPEPLDFRSLLILAVYIVVFAIDVRLFLTGRHLLAWSILFGGFLIALGAVLRGSIRREFHG
jgi:hypothetical protein